MVDVLAIVKNILKVILIVNCPVDYQTGKLVLVLLQKKISLPKPWDWGDLNLLGSPPITESLALWGGIYIIAYNPLAEVCDDVIRWPHLEASKYGVAHAKPLAFGVINAETSAHQRQTGECPQRHEDAEWAPSSVEEELIGEDFLSFLPVLAFRTESRATGLHVLRGGPGYNKGDLVTLMAPNNSPFINPLGSLREGFLQSFKVCTCLCHNGNCARSRNNPGSFLLILSSSSTQGCYRKTTSITAPTILQHTFRICRVVCHQLVYKRLCCLSHNCGQRSANVVIRRIELLLGYQA